MPLNERLCRALVVDDKQSNIDVASCILEMEGYMVDAATNGAEGLSLAKTTIYTCILSDFKMPVMDGFEFLRQTQLTGLRRSTRFIMLTADDEALYNRCKAAGIYPDALLSKPYAVMELRQAIKGTNSAYVAIPDVTPAKRGRPSFF